MIWIKNHGISGESDNLRIPLSHEIPEIISYQADKEQANTVVKLRKWTGIEFESNIDSTVENKFETVLGNQIRFAHNEDADHTDFDSKAEELDAYYNGTHPDL